MLQKKLEEAKSFLQNHLPSPCDTAIVLGSGLGKISEKISNPVRVPYQEIPHFYSTTVAGHSGELIYGNLNGTDVILLSGRIHAYEGHELDSVVFPVRLLKSYGVKNLILTNASGGINKSFNPGDLCLITDHINLTGMNPLIGENLNFLGPRFPDMSQLYNKKHQEIVQACANQLNINIHQGVYAGVLGPSYETPSEVKMLRTLGGDLVGMSTVFEAIAAHHCGLNVTGISCVTNMAAGIIDEMLRHEDIKEKADQAFSDFSLLIENFIEKL